MEKKKNVKNMDLDNKNSVLSFESLSVGYRNGKKIKTVADQLCGKLCRGKLTSLIGSNGTGKSTLLRTLAGFQPALDGKVSLGGKELKSIPSNELARLVSVVLTDRVMVPNATVFEIAALGRSPYHGRWNRFGDEDHKIINEALDQCGIAYKRDELLSSLSDGERQKVFIAKALIQKTDIIILDEPAAFLDFSARIEIMKLLRDIASSRNIAILLSSHDLDLALQLSDNIWLFYPNGPILDGTPEDLLWERKFDEIFHSDHLKYDPLRGKYEVFYRTKKKINVAVPKDMFALLVSAFKREGVEISSVNRIEKNGISWNQNCFNIVDNNNIAMTCYTISELVQFCCKESKININTL